MNNEPRHLLRQRVDIGRDAAQTDDAGAVTLTREPIYTQAPCALWPDARAVDDPDNDPTRPVAERVWTVYLSCAYLLRPGDVLTFENRELRVVGLGDLAGRRVLQKLTCREVM